MAVIVGIPSCKSSTSTGKHEDFPLYFPKPNFRGRPIPVEDDDSDWCEATGGGGASRGVQKAASIVDERRVKFQEIAGGNGTVTADTAATFIRNLGFSPSQADIAQLYAHHSDEITFDAVIKWAAECRVAHKGEDRLDQMEPVFSLYDPMRRGVVALKQIRHILGSFGEALTDEELDCLFTELGLDSTSEIKYQDFVKLLLAPPPKP